ncbi:50S ribosomal protein [Salix suchowensis]|nr:50S ribosomal protein [Salix suchowensis]
MAKVVAKPEDGNPIPQQPLSPPQPFHSQSSRYHTIQAIPREVVGSRVSAREREQGRIPAVVFSQSLLDINPSNRYNSRKRLLTTEKKQIQAILKSVEIPFFCSTTFPLQIRAGSGSSALLESGTVLPIKAREENCPGLKKGGHLKMMRKTLKYLCPAEHIPQKIEVDISNLDIEDGLFMHDVEVHPSLKLLSKNENMPVCKIVATNLDTPEPAALNLESPEPAEI